MKSGNLNVLEHSGPMHACNGTDLPLLSVCVCVFLFYPMPHMSLTDFVVFPPRDGRSVTDFSGWDAHEARLRCPDDVSGDIGGCSARRALNPNFY